MGTSTMVDPYDFTKNRSFDDKMPYEDLLGRHLPMGS